MDKMLKIKEKYLQKGKFNKTKVLISIIISIAIAIVLVVLPKNHIWDRLPIFAIIIEFIFLHFIFKIKDMYEFIYKKRFIIAIIFMLYVVIMGYSGSSIATYTEVIQGQYQEKNFTPILGRYRSIRSDEWSVSTPIILSQAIDKENPFSYFNDNLRGTETDMSSIGNSPILDISIISKPLNLGYILLGPERGLSFVWYGKLTLMLLVSFEFCMLLTNKKKLISLMGMFLISFSAATQWWYATEYFIWGMLALIFFDKFMLAKNIKTKILYGLGIFISGLSYIFIFYPAWQLSFGYIYLAIFIWICIKNRKEYKFKWTDVLIILIILLVIGGMLGRYLIKSQEALKLTMSTDYPGERFELGGGTEAKKVVFSYVYSFLFPYVGIENPCEYSGMLSFFPIPILLAIICIIKGIKNKDTKMFPFLIPMLVITTILTVWTFITTNHLFAKLTFLYMVPPNRMAVTLGVTQILLLVYLMGNIPKDYFKFKYKMVVTLILALVLNVGIVYMAKITDDNMVMKGFRIYICAALSLITIFEMLNIDSKRHKNILALILIATAFITGTTVNPIQKGISVLNNKPIARQIQKIVSEDKENNLWIVDSTVFFVPNYALVNGAKVINSTNIYPNFELYKTVLGDEADKEEIRKIYNRYAHLNIEIGEENKLELLFQDSIKLYLTTEKLKELSVKYIFSTRDNLTDYNKESIKYEQIYSEYGLYIYKLNY